MKKNLALLMIAIALLCPAISNAARQVKYTEPLAANLTEAQRSAAQAIADFTGDRADLFEKNILIGHISRQRALNQETATEIIRLVNARDYNQNGFDDQPIMLALIDANLEGEQLRRVSQVLRNRPYNAQAYGAIAREYAATVLSAPAPQSVSAEDRSRRNTLIESLVTRIDTRIVNEASAREVASQHNHTLLVQIRTIAQRTGFSAAQSKLLSALLGERSRTSFYSMQSTISRISEPSFSLTATEADRLVSIVNQAEPRFQNRIWVNISELVLRNKSYLSLPTEVLSAVLETYTSDYSYSRNPRPALLAAYNEGPISPNRQAIIDALMKNRAALRDSNALSAVAAVAGANQDFSEHEKLTFIALAQHADAERFFRSSYYSNHGLAIELLEWRNKRRAELSLDNAAFLRTLLASPEFGITRHSATIFYLITTKSVDASIAQRILASAQSSRQISGFSNSHRESLVGFMISALSSQQTSAQEEQILFETARRALSLRGLGEEEQRILLGKIRTSFGPAHIAFVNAAMTRIEADPTAMNRLFPYGVHRGRTELEYRLVLQAEDALNVAAARRTRTGPELDYVHTMLGILAHPSSLSSAQARLISAILSLESTNSHRNGIDENKAIQAILHSSALSEAQAEVILEILRNTELFGQPMFRPTDALLLTIERAPSPAPQQATALREILRRENGACMLRYRTQKETLYAAVAQGQEFATENQNLLSPSNTQADCQSLVGALRPLVAAPTVQQETR